MKGTPAVVAIPHARKPNRGTQHISRSLCVTMYPHLLYPPHLMGYDLWAACVLLSVWHSINEKVRHSDVEKDVQLVIASSVKIKSVLTVVGP